MKFIFRISFCILALTAIPAGLVFAADVSFEARLNAERVPMGSAVQLTLTLHGTQEVGEISLPAIDGFQSRYVGPSTQVSVINGAYSTSKSFNYILVPLKEGNFSIPSIEVLVKGQTYKSQPVSIEVAASEASARADQGPNALNDSQSIADRVKMHVFIPKSEGYIYEEIPLVIKLYVSELPIQDISFPQITQEGFVLSEFSRPRQYQELLNGKTFEVVEFRALLTPIRTGVINIGPAVISGSLMVKNNSRRQPLSGSVFDDDFFNGFFSSFQKKPVTVTSRGVEFTVKELPNAEAPSDFSGGVGRFTFNVTAAPLKVKAGDPITLKMSVAGTGDLKTIKLPVFEDTRFKVYDPQIKQENGEKNFEQVIVPLKEGALDIPVVKFSYFDTQEGKYVTLERGPFPIEVLPMEEGQEFQAVAFAERPVSLLKESLGNDIVFIKDRPGVLLKKRGWLWRNGWLLTVLLVYIHVWGVLFGVYLYRRKLMDDPGFARRSAAMRAVRSAMSALQPLIVEGEAREFYSQLFKIFTDYLEKKMNILPGNADLGSVESILTAKQVENKKVALLKELYDLADRARFASASVSVAEMKRSFLDMEDVLESIDRGVK